MNTATTHKPWEYVVLSLKDMKVLASGSRDECLNYARENATGTLVTCTFQQAANLIGREYYNA